MVLLAQGYSAATAPASARVAMVAMSGRSDEYVMCDKFVGFYMARVGQAPDDEFEDGCAELEAAIAHAKYDSGPA